MQVVLVLSNLIVLNAFPRLTDIIAAVTSTFVNDGESLS